MIAMPHNEQGLPPVWVFEKQKLNNIMKQNRITTVQDIGSSPHSGKPLVMGSTVFNEDCMTVMARYPDKYFDLAIVDPPYGIDVNNSIGFRKQQTILHKEKNWDNEVPSAEYWKELFRVSKNQIVWGGNYFIEHLKNTRCFLVWDKMNGTNSMADCELAWTSFDGSVRKYARHIFTGVGNSNYTTIHPTQKPIQIYEWALSFLKEGNLILDTHLGSGSSRIAAYKLGLNFIGCEIDKDYYEAQESRFKEFTSQLRLFG